MNKTIDIVKIMKEWQKPDIKLVHVAYFTLSPQAQGFYLNCEFYIADKYNPEMGYIKENFFGGLEECFAQALEYMSFETERLKELL